MIREADAKCERVHYHGKVQYSEALQIMNNSDYIVALYYPYMSNHVYASPNKSYESLFLGTPIITSEGTLVGDKVLANNTGYVVDDTLAGLRSAFENWETKEYKDEYYCKCVNCRNLWRTAYADYRINKLENEYINTMRNL